MHRTSVASFTFVAALAVALGLPACGAKTGLPSDGGGTGGSAGVSPGTGGTGGSGGAGGGAGGAAGTGGAGRGGSGGAGGAGGAVVDGGPQVSMCPANPQGKACQMGTACTIGAGGAISGGCACPAGTWVCPTIPDGGIDALISTCPANAATGVACTTAGTICIAAGDGGTATGCFCTMFGPLLRWQCLGR